MSNQTSVNHYESLRASTVQDSGVNEGMTVSMNGWIPTSGKKFRVKRARVVITVRAATGSTDGVLVYLADGTASTTPVGAVGILPDSAAAGTMIEQTFDFGDGYLSIAADNALQVRLSSTLETGSLNCFVEAQGDEE